MQSIHTHTKTFWFIHHKETVLHVKDNGDCCTANLEVVEFEQ